MLSKRIIPCLDVDKGRVVKGTNFVDIKDAGDPVELAERYYHQGADELCFLDITASHEARKATYEIIERTAKKIFIPLTVGGGVSSVEDASRLLQAGADKVSINSSAVRNPKLVSELAASFGSQCVVIAIDVKRTNQTQSSWEVFVRGGREATGIDAIQWASDTTKSGVGEILLTSMDRDGTNIGYDLEITRKISQLVNVPVIASGGAGSLQDIVDAFKSGADAALLASLLHYGKLTIAEIKAAMKDAEILARV